MTTEAKGKHFSAKTFCQRNHFFDYLKRFNANTIALLVLWAVNYIYVLCFAKDSSNKWNSVYAIASFLKSMKYPQGDFAVTIQFFP